MYFDLYSYDLEETVNYIKCIAATSSKYDCILRYCTRIRGRNR